MNSINVPSMPTSIPRASLTKWLEDNGINISRVLADSLIVDETGIRFDALAEDANGEIARVQGHTVSVRVDIRFTDKEAK